MFKQSLMEPLYHNGIYLNKEITFGLCGYEDCKSGYQFGPYSRNYFLIHYIVKGKGVFEIGNNKYPLEKNQGFLIVPKTETTYYADIKDPWSYVWVAFNGTSVEDLLKLINLFPDNPTFTYTGKENMEQMFMDVIEPQSTEDILYFRQMRLLYSFLHELSIGRIPPDNNSKSAQYIYLKKTTQYIKIYMHKNIRVSEIASHIGIDRSHLCRIFKKHYNMSVKEYILNLKIETARDMLKEKNFEIKYIANAVGYPDAFAFSRLFKLKTGYSPSEYKKYIECNTQFFV